MSGYDSETALVSQSSLEQGETHVVISLNSSLTRFILMLDIWLTQVRLIMHIRTFCILNIWLTHVRIKYWSHPQIL